MLSGKGGGIAETIRRFAQKQQSFKECVIAHCSSDPAPKMTGTKQFAEAVRCKNIGRGAFYIRLKR